MSDVAFVSFQTGCQQEQLKIEKIRWTRVPIIGRVVCGFPGDAEECIEGYLPLPSAWLKGDPFALIAYGDSMIDAGIHEGDYLLLTRACEAPDGVIVSVWTEDGSTLKRIGTENGKRVLYAENKTYPPDKLIIRPREMRIQGVLLKVIHDAEKNY